MQYVLLIGHKARVGKDTVAEFLSTYGWIRSSFADKLKEVVMDLYDFSKEQMYGDLKDNIDSRYGITPRKVLQDFGQEQRSRFPDIWGQYVFTSIDRSPYPENYVVPDFRFPNEYIVAKKWEQEDPDERRVVTIKIDRPERPVVSGAEDISETALDYFAFWDYEILNNGSIQDLQENILGILFEIGVDV